MCIFCNIIKNSSSSNTVYIDDQLIIINDLHPKADNHFLIISKKHIENIGNAHSKEDLNILSYLFSHIPHIASVLNLKDFKIISNSGKDAGQEVFHLHVHLMAGPQLKELI